MVVVVRTRCELLKNWLFVCQNLPNKTVRIKKEDIRVKNPRKLSTPFNIKNYL